MYNLHFNFRTGSLSLFEVVFLGIFRSYLTFLYTMFCFIKQKIAVVFVHL